MRRGDPGGRTSLDAGLARAHPAPTGSRAIAASRAQSPGLPGPRPALPGSRPTPRPPAPGASLSLLLAALSKGDLRGLCPPSAATAGLPGLRLLWVTGESTPHSPAPRRPPHTSAARRREASTEAAAASSSFRQERAYGLVLAPEASGKLRDPHGATGCGRDLVFDILEQPPRPTKSQIETLQPPWSTWLCSHKTFFIKAATATTTGRVSHSASGLQSDDPFARRGLGKKTCGLKIIIRERLSGS